MPYTFVETKKRTFFEEITGTVDEIIREVRRLIKEGNARSLIIRKKDGKELFKTQLSIGVAGTALFTVMAPIISAITMFVMFANDVEVLVEKHVADSDKDNEEHQKRDEYEVEGEIIDIQEEEDETDSEGNKE